MLGRRGKVKKRPVLMVYEIREPGTRAIVNFNKVLTPYIHQCSGFPDLMIRTPQVTDQYKKNNKVSNRHFSKNDIDPIGYLMSYASILSETH